MKGQKEAERSMRRFAVSIDAKIHRRINKVNWLHRHRHTTSMTRFTKKRKRSFEKKLDKIITLEAACADWKIWLSGGAYHSVVAHFHIGAQ